MHFSSNLKINYIHNDFIYIMVRKNDKINALCYERKNTGNCKISELGEIGIKTVIQDKVM